MRNFKNWWRPIRNEMPSRSAGLYSVIFLLLVGVLILIACNGEVVQKDVSSAILSLLGVFIGATLSFRLNEDREKQKQEADNRAALNRALFVLARQDNAVKQLLKDVRKYNSQFEKAFNLPAIQPPAYLDLSHNFADLDFLLDTTFSVVLFELSIEQERFFQVLESLRIRNVFYVGEVLPALAQFKLGGQEVSSEQMKALLGDRVFGGAMSGVKIACDQIEASSISLPLMGEKIWRLAKEIYPDHKFITYQYK